MNYRTLYITNLLSLTWTHYFMDALYPTRALSVYPEQLSPSSTLDIRQMVLQLTYSTTQTTSLTYPSSNPHNRPPLCMWTPFSPWSGNKTSSVGKKKVDSLMQMLLTKLFRKGRGKQKWKAEIILRITNYLFQKLKASFTYYFICPRMESHSLD